MAPGARRAQVNQTEAIFAPAEGLHRICGCMSTSSNLLNYRSDIFFLGFDAADDRVRAVQELEFEDSSSTVDGGSELSLHRMVVTSVGNEVGTYPPRRNLNKQF